jgi:alkanesulfonate monooxygenase SsuD/methylene tetrahydromethanopterin reductase-like flavin-dependent oxidoreductase (luciferase family)
MQAGITILNGLMGEYDGWEPSLAWRRAVDMGAVAERLGFAFVWVPDHLRVIRGPDEAPTFEAFTLLTALAERTSRVRLGPGVACVGFRNPALLVKMTTSLDLASGGRAELPLGAGWYEAEWRSYGYGFPPTRERLAQLEETLEIATRMLRPGRATWHGERFAIEDVVAEPKGLQQPRIPIVVGGNGQKVTWRLAARFADELNLDGPSLADIHAWLPIIRQRCEEADRDPATLPVSAEIWWDGATGRARVEQLAEIAELGLVRIHSHLREAAASDEPLISFAEDCRAAGVELAAATPA